EEEEIDVVTVEKRPAVTPGDAGAISASSNTNTAGVRLQSEPCDHALKRCHFPIHQQHNYAAPSPPSPPPTKRWRTEAAATAVAVRSAARGEPARLPAFTRGNSTSSSDSEESERRRTHNILERQRRDGLRSSFLGLRDVIPELCRNDKAAKVMILRKAGEYAKRLVAEEHRLLLEKRQAEARQHQLLRKIESLKR
uniref:BHLH domain-containing protein n=1 Tax=Petromyzon marinus TaxID=7757 RepID=S4RX61_PETMA